MLVLTSLREATAAACGGKAAALGALLREGFPVPDGFVVPSYLSHPGGVIAPALRDDIACELERLGDPVVAVRSSATNEDTATASAAGQYESIIGVRGIDQVCGAVISCWESADAARVRDYWQQPNGVASAHCAMAVLVQPMVEPEVSGVMFTADQPGAPTRIEASWGLGLSVVGGTVTPDTYEISPDGVIEHALSTKTTRLDLDRHSGDLVASDVNPDEQNAPCLTAVTIAHLADLGGRITDALGQPQDIEWVLKDGVVSILQSRPITADLPTSTVISGADPARVLTGRPASNGRSTGPVRIVLGPSDFGTVQEGDIVVCRYTDPAWTPLFRIAGAIVTQTGGVLSHAAIVAREYGLPAVVGTRDATTILQPGDRVTVDGSAGTITRH